jgi:hypothetical protein
LEQIQEVWAILLLRVCLLLIGAAQPNVRQMSLQLNLRRIVFRLWYYFRIGYGTYLTFLLGFVSTIVTVYYLAINNIPFLKSIFPTFWLFGLLALAVGVPLAVSSGYAHFKRSQAYSAEVDIGVEANPYYYKITPGKEKDMTIPISIANIDLLLVMAKKLGVLTPQIESTFLEVRQKYVNLAKRGDYRISSPDD